MTRRCSSHGQLDPKLHRLAGEIAGDEGSQRRSKPGSRRKLSTVIGRCGWKKRSPQRLEKLDADLDRAGIYTSVDIEDLDVGLDTWVLFGREPFVELGHVFKRVLSGTSWQPIQNHLKGRFRSSDASAIGMGSKPERSFHDLGTPLRPDLVFKASNGTWVACELERGDPKRESVGQLEQYLRALDAHYAGPVAGLLITARPRAANLGRLIEGQMMNLRRSYPDVAWLTYDIRVSVQKMG